MDIRHFLVTVAQDYDRKAGLQTPTQALLRGAGSALATHVPAGLLIKGSGGKGTATLTPWVGVFDPDETTSPEEGLYVVYLFGAELDRVCLMLLQGITKLDRELGHAAARDHLAAEAEQIRQALPAGALDGVEATVDLGGGGFRQLAYAAACVAARTYRIDDLPAEGGLRDDLLAMLLLYQEAIHAKWSVAVLDAETSTAAAAAHAAQLQSDPLAQFRPKDESDYIAHLAGRQLVKSRRHERLVREYGEWSQAQGFTASTTEHPKDLVLRRNGAVWLVEAKVLYRGNATEAVRAAVGQLFQYQFFLCNESAPTNLVALFSEPIGDAYADFLESLGIAAVWKEEGKWRGSARAGDEGVASATGA